MKVLSLFDGMSCGRIALDRLGIAVDTYYASEIDKYAIEVAQKNYPDTIHVGDVTQLNADDFQDVDLILAGSPCQGFSFAGKQLAFDDPRSALFFEFIRLLKAIKPKYFLLENVKMKKEFLEVITDQVSACYPEFQGHDLFGGRIEPILINSSLVSAQSRQRYYWTNIPNIQQPEDRGIILRDILETDAISDEFIHGQKSVDYMNRGNEKWQQAGNRRADRYEQSADKEKSFAITANWHKGVPYNYFKETRLTKPKQVGMASEISGHDILKRVYSPDGKSPTLNAHGGGNTEPKVMVDKSHPIKANYYKSSRANFENDQSKGGKFSATGVPVRSKIRKKSKTVRSGGRDSYDRHEWDSVDELHWRKLTPLECERLQTVPDNYTNHVSNTQRYKMLGNGWTVDVIAHIFTFMQRAHNGEHLVTKGQINLDL
jgi:DNA (cytosine-5)-methyltransferase 3A